MHILLLCFLFVNHPHLIINCANVHAHFTFLPGCKTRKVTAKFTNMMVNLKKKYLNFFF